MTKLLFIPIMILALSITSCKKEEEVTPVVANDNSQYGYITSDMGARFTVTDSEGSYEVSSSNIVYTNGSLLNYNFWRGFRIDLPTSSIYVRYNMVEGMDWKEEVEGTNTLYPNQLLLEWTGDLDDYVIEVYGWDPDGILEGPAIGTITTHFDVQGPIDTYALAGSMDLTFQGLYSVEGEFWRKTE